MNDAIGCVIHIVNELNTLYYRYIESVSNGSNLLCFFIRKIKDIDC